MPTNLKSTAPHIANASTWEEDLVDWGVHPDAIEGTSKDTGRLLWKGPVDNLPEAGLWVCTPGKWRLFLERDEFCHFVSGRATYVSDEGEIIEVTPGTLVHFCQGWSGVATVHETTRNIYMIR